MNTNGSNQSRIDLLNSYEGHSKRQLISYSMGTFDECKELLTVAIMKMDTTISKLNWIKEYDEVVDWMTNTQGKGLFLTGDCGLGKSTIIYFAIPFIFARIGNKVFTRVHCDDLGNKLEALMSKKMLCIDDVGAEPLTVDYGSKYYPFMKIMNKAELEFKFILATSNLNSSQLINKYDERTADRIKRLCRVVKLEGKSLRK